MKWKVLIVEDEPLEQEALSLFLKSAPFSAEIRVADNSIAFTTTAMDWNPDIVLLDIRIPGENGLSTLQELRDKGFTAKVLILTAYDIFEYAQRALELGVQAFLLKPVSREKLYHTLDRVIAQITQEKNGDGYRKQFLQFIRDNSNLLTRVILSDLGASGSDYEASETIMKELSLLQSFPYRVIGVIVLDPHTQDHPGDSFRFLETSTRSFGDALVIPWSRRSTLILAPQKKDTPPENLGTHILAVLAENAINGNVVIMGVAHNAEQLGESIRSLEESLEESLLGGTGRVVWRDREIPPAIEKIELWESSWFAAKVRITEGFRSGLLSQMIDGRNQLMLFLERSPLDAELGKMLLFGLFGEICDTLLSLRCDTGAIRGWSRRQMLNLLSANNSIMLSSILVQCLESAWKIRESFQNEHILIISLALEYIQKHFDEVTLESVSKHVHVSSAHLSRLFAKVLQKRFVDVVKEKRMEKARELLLSGMSVRDVALRVGYGNIAYFSTLFKQVSGTSPSEYAKHQGD